MYFFVEKKMFYLELWLLKGGGTEAHVIPVVGYSHML